MVLTALRGAVGFLTRLPVGTDQRAWDAFSERPAVLPLAGYLIGFLVAVPFLFAGPAPTVALAYLLAVIAVTGINHADGLADLGDAAVVHGDAERRQAVLKDTTVGVGAVVAVTVGFVGLGLGGLALAGLPPRTAVALAVAAEVGAKLAMATLAATGQPSHDGLGAQLLGARPGTAVVAGLFALPAGFLAWPSLSGLVAVAVGPVVALALRWWAHARLGGVNGDVFGATNDLARVVAVHAGVVAWTLS